jgi:hypothetical protein
MAGEQFIQRGRHSSGFSALSNRIWEDDRLSVEAKGTLGYLLSRPANWRVRIAQVAKKLMIGRDRLYRIINECIEAGYVERRQARSAGAFKPVTYYVRDVALLPHPDLPDTAEPDTAEPDTAEPDTANQEALIRRRSNNKDVEQVESSTTPSPPRAAISEPRACEGDEIAKLLLQALSVSARAHPGWRGLSEWIAKLLANGVERVDIVVGIHQCLQSLKDRPPTSFSYFSAAIERAREARTRLLSQVVLPQRPEQPHHLGQAGDCLRKRLGNDVFAAWFGHASIISECGDTVTLGVRTKFIRSRIIAEYEAACVSAFSAQNPSIARVAVVVAEGANV